MDEIMKDLEAAFKATSAIPVTGDAVDALALVRNKLRKVYTAVERIDAENKANKTVSQDEELDIGGLQNEDFKVHCRGSDH